MEIQTWMMYIQNRYIVSTSLTTLSREDVSGGDTKGASKNSVKSVRAEVEERNKDTLKPVE